MRAEDPNNSDDFHHAYYVPLSPSRSDLLVSIDHLPNRNSGRTSDRRQHRTQVDRVSRLDRSKHCRDRPGSVPTGTSAGQVYAIERDPASDLRSNRLPRNRPDYTEADCLDHPLAGLKENDAKADFSIVANLPYAAPLDGGSSHRPPSQTNGFNAPKEAADRYASKTAQNFGAISIFQSAYHIHNRHLVAASCFYPEPS